MSDENVTPSTLEKQLESCKKRRKEIWDELTAYKDLVADYGIGHHKDCNNRYDNHLMCDCDKDTAVEDLQKRGEENEN